MLPRVALFLAVVLLSGCGGDPAARYEAAHAAFDAASTGADYDAVLGDLGELRGEIASAGEVDKALDFQVAYLEVRCRGRKGDASASEAIAKLETDWPKEMAQIGRYLELCQDLVQGKQAVAAAELLGRCGERFPAEKEKLEKMATSIARLGDTKANEALRGLGYLGGG
ncbi:MAG: hypothetical protein AB1486_08460 [Planctomycetota bacterium]